MFWTVKRKIETPAEEKLEQIRNILFPPSKVESSLDKDGQQYKWQVEYSLDMNLDAALIDLQEGNNDAAVHNTINSVVKSLHKVREIFEEHMELDPDAKYMVVESMEDKVDVSE